jgi:Outer membrane protein Omp28
MQIFLPMKKTYFLALFLITIAFSSCSDTVVVENRPDQSATAPAIPGYFKKRALIEDYTGTWCGNCTRVAYAIDLAKEQSDKVVSVAIHYGNDPYNFGAQAIAPLKNLISPNAPLALPVSRLNRLNVWTFPETSNIQEAIDLTGNNTTLGLAMNSTLNGSTIDLDVNVQFLDDYSNLKLVVYMLENHLIYFQRNYLDYYGGIDPIQNFEHNHVLRKPLTYILGDEITNTTEGNTITKSFSVNLSDLPYAVNGANVSFVAFVVGEDNKVINVRESHIDENQAFEINP